MITDLNDILLTAKSRSPPADISDANKNQSATCGEYYAGTSDKCKFAPSSCGVRLLNIKISIAKADFLYEIIIVPAMFCIILDVRLGVLV